MDIIWTLGGPGKASKGGQTIQVERVPAVCKPPKKRAVAHINGGNKNRNLAGCTPEPFWRRIKCLNLILNTSYNGQVH
jgi:hypothetical protein